MQDRLKELKGGSGADDEASHEDVEVGVTKGKGSANGEGEFMDTYFQEVGTVKTMMTQIRRNIKSIEEKYVQSLNSISVEQGHKTGNDVQTIIDATNGSVTEVRQKLDAMRKSNADFAESKGASSTEKRIRSNMHATLTQKFLELVQEYQEVQTTYKNKYKDKIERQYKIAKPDASQEEIEEVIQTGDSSKIFANQILDTHLHQQAKNALAYVQSRHQDILRLEASIEELHQLFVDMAAMVELQGEMLNQIEFNVSQSLDYVVQGTKELKGAVEQQKKGRKKMYIIMGILIVIIIVILAPTLLTLLKK